MSENPNKLDINLPISYDHPEVMTAEQIEQQKKMGGAPLNLNVENQHSELSHANAISYNAELDQIVVSFKYFNEIYIIDHSTTTEEAKGNTGGRWGHGGDILYGWGKPQNYHRGNENNIYLEMQHDVKFIPKGYPGEGNLLVFNNNILNPEINPSLGAGFAKLKSPNVEISIGDSGDYSAVYEFKAPPEGNILFQKKVLLVLRNRHGLYTAPDKYSFYSAFVSGAQRLKNGNTLITEGARGRFLEVTLLKRNQSGNIGIHICMIISYQMDRHLTTYGPFIFAQFRGTHFTPRFSCILRQRVKSNYTSTKSNLCLRCHHLHQQKTIVLIKITTKDLVTI